MCQSHSQLLGSPHRQGCGIRARSSVSKSQGNSRQRSQPVPACHQLSAPPPHSSPLLHQLHLHPHLPHQHFCTICVPACDPPPWHEAHELLLETTNASAAQQAVVSGLSAAHRHAVVAALNTLFIPAPASRSIATRSAQPLALQRRSISHQQEAFLRKQPPRRPGPRARRRRCRLRPRPLAHGCISRHRLASSPWIALFHSSFRNRGNRCNRCNLRSRVHPLLRQQLSRSPFLHQAHVQIQPSGRQRS